jgi:gliding motility-associated-like protein
MPGNYIVSASFKNSKCFTQTQRISVIVSDAIHIAEFQYEIDLGVNGSLVNSEVQLLDLVQFQDISVGKIIIWNWDFGDGSSSSERNPTHTYDKVGQYTVRLTTIDEFGCSSEFQKVINVFDDYLIIVPNAFTPSGEKNQLFMPKHRGLAKLEFYIFNTWGELIHYSDQFENLGWDGRLNNTDTPNGNYVYRVDFTSRSGEKGSKSGVFILIR